MFSKSVISQSFSQAAVSYDKVANLQREMGTRLLSLVPEGRYSTVLDLGCGTGYFNALLQEQLEPGQLLGLDLAEGMIGTAKRAKRSLASSWCCADAEYLPLKDGTCSLIYSNLVLQWCNDLSRVFDEASRVLADNGWFVFSSLGPDTLFELKCSWQQADDYVHVNQFTAKEEIVLAAEEAGFDCQSQSEKIVMGYQQVRDLSATLKSLGAGNMNHGRRKGLMGRRSVQKMLQHYESYRDEKGILPATYEAYYFLLRKMK